MTDAFVSWLGTGGVWMLVAFALAFVATGIVKHIAVRLGVVDTPTSPRKVHQHPIPLLGGMAIFFSIALCVLILLTTSDALTGGEIQPMHYMGFLLGGLVLIIGGFLDDKFELPPYMSILSPLVAALVTIGFGVEIDKLTNPFGGIIELTAEQSDLLVFGWLIVVMYTTKFLDGLDGLSTGVSAIGTLMIMLLSLTVAYYQPDVALLSAVCLGALIGFLRWNFHPASIFLGEGGSTFVGFVIGVLAVISGGKLATAMLVLGIPFLDVIWVVLRRARSGGVTRIFKGDRKHLHHRLLDLGWGQRRIVILYYLVALAFGMTTLVLQSREKLIALGALTCLMLFAAFLLVRHEYATPRVS